MIDLHSHILPGVDDGSGSLDESLEILQKLQKIGFKEVFVTPHYIENSKYTSTKTKNTPLFKKLENVAKDIDVKLHLANEVFVTPDFAKLAKNHKVATIDGKHLLFELPLHGEINNLMDIVHEIKIAGFTPILAHPERYDFIKKDPKIINELKENGVLIQCNYGSLLGKYGKRAQKTIELFLEKRLVDFMGTDIHHATSDLLKKLPKALKRLKKLAGKEYFTYLTEGTALKEQKTFTLKRKHTLAKVLCGIFVTLLLAFGTIAGIYLKRTKDFIDTITSSSEGVEQVEDIINGPFIVYISGIDVAGDIETESRSDVNIVMAINPTTSKILIINIPRDYYVPLIIPGNDAGIKDKLTHTGLYGVETSVATVENFMNIDIDYYIRVNFSTLENLVNLIEGIEIDSDNAFTSAHYKDCKYKVGLNYVNGRCALGYARDRQHQRSGDIARAEHQGRVLEAIIAKIFEPSFFVANYLTILDETMPNLQTDISADNLNKLIEFELNERPNWQVERYALYENGTKNYGYTYPDMLLWMGEPDWSTVDIAKDKIKLLVQGI